MPSTMDSITGLSKWAFDASTADLPVRFWSKSKDSLLSEMEMDFPLTVTASFPPEVSSRKAVKLGVPGIFGEVSDSDFLFFVCCGLVKPDNATRKPGDGKSYQLPSNNRQKTPEWCSTSNVFNAYQNKCLVEKPPQKRCGCQIIVYIVFFFVCRCVLSSVFLPTVRGMNIFVWLAGKLALASGH